MKNKRSFRILANYMMWTVVSYYAASLSRRFREVFLQFNEETSGSRLPEDPRWQKCLKEVDGSFGMALGVLFVDKKFKGESKSTVGIFLSFSFSFSFVFVLFCFVCLLLLLLLLLFVVVVVVVSVSLMIGVCLPS